MRRSFVLAALVLGMAVSGACGGGSKSPAPASPTAAPTTTPYIKTDLAPEQMGAMTLSLAEFGPPYATFAPHSDGPLTAILERAVTACNPDNESQALGKYEWVKGYTHYFAAPDEGASGTLMIGSDIDVFSSAENASAKIKYDQTAIENDSRQGWGCQGVKVERIDEFPVEGLGDEAWGVRIRFSDMGIRGTQTVVFFRRDRVVATVSTSRLNAEDVSAELIAAARVADGKMMPILTVPVS
jgi:hypothetical protein